MMRIYLDMCCFNRPYDPQDQLKISMETQSKLKIQRLIEEGKLELIGSYTLDYECSNVPVPMRKRSIKEILYKNMSGYVGIERDKEISKIAKKSWKQISSSKMLITLPRQFMLAAHFLLPRTYVY